MTSSHDHKTVSKVELLVLARCAPKDGAKLAELDEVVADFAAGNGKSAADLVAGLQRRSLLAAAGPRARCKLTSAGRSALCEALGVDEALTWRDVKPRCLSQLGLAAPRDPKQPGSRTATKKRPKIDAHALAVLKQRLQIKSAGSLSALCDVLLAKALGFSGKITLPALHAHVLARSLGIDPAEASTMTREEVARRAAERSHGNGGNGRRPAQQPLGFHDAQGAIQGGSRAQGATSSGGTSIGTYVPPRAPAPASNVVEGDRLLNLVREAIPRIGSDGRFGPEKVFVSALWHYLEDDGRLPDLSLERFKGWLVTANRDQMVDLVRADSQGDMDARLLEESEIRDLGSTFHFVIDRQMAASRRGYYAR